MMSNGKGLRNPYTARGICIATGEFLPNIPVSRLARSIIVPIQSESINLDRLTELQNNREQLAFCMMEFIRWIILNEQYIRTTAKNYMLQLQKSQNNQIHGRTNEAINVMWIAYDLFLQFLQGYGVISQEQKQGFSNEGYQVLLNISIKQQNEIEESNPINLFYSAIDELLSTGRIYLLDYATGLPIEENQTGKVVGYLDKKKKRYYFIPGLIYSEVCKFYATSNNKFPLTSLSLWRYLQEEGLLYMTDSSRKTVLKTDVRTKKKVRVVDIKIIDNQVELQQHLEEDQQ